MTRVIRRKLCRKFLGIVKTGVETESGAGEWQVENARFVVILMVFINKNPSTIAHHNIDKHTHTNKSTNM